MFERCPICGSPQDQIRKCEAKLASHEHEINRRRVDYLKELDEIENRKDQIKKSLDTLDKEMEQVINWPLDDCSWLSCLTSSGKNRYGKGHQQSAHPSRLPGAGNH